MDALDQLVRAGAGLLVRVDDILARSGAPDGDPVWPLLRRLRALPGEAVRAVAAFDPAPLATAGSALHDLRPGYARGHAAVARGVDWTGGGADSFEAHRTALATHLSDDPDGLTGRLAATATYAEAVAEWLAGSRATLARTLATVLTCAEAVTLTAAAPAGAGPDSDDALAAARVGTVLLQAVADVYESGEALLRRHASGLAEVPYRAPADPPPGHHTDLRLPL
ncbi:hypothetical protein [Polymorphospora sp. NPDC051019]|uniref:hypothetical protein n=1 Tax=unclassified Polymorphospora TaxID=2685497 RepID=UPI0034406581